MVRFLNDPRAAYSDPALGDLRDETVAKEQGDRYCGPREWPILSDLAHW